MKIQEVINEINEASKHSSKLLVVKIINTIRGGGLIKSKDIVDNYFSYNDKNSGNTIIKYLKTTDEWIMIKSNIRKLKTLN